MRRHRLCQGIHQRHIDHRGLVHHEQIAIERVLLVLRETTVLWINLQQAVDGLGLNPGLLGHAFGRASCGSRQRHPNALSQQQPQDRIQQRRLADTGSTRHHGDLGGKNQLQSLPLRGRQGLARTALDPWNGLVEVDLGPGRWARCSLDQS